MTEEQAIAAGWKKIHRPEMQEYTRRDPFGNRYDKLPEHDKMCDRCRTDTITYAYAYTTTLHGVVYTKLCNNCWRGFALKLLDRGIVKTDELLNHAKRTTRLPCPHCGRS